MCKSSPSKPASVIASARGRIVPTGTIEFCAVPRHVLQAALVHRTVEELVEPHRFVHFPETDHFLPKPEQVRVFIHERPVKPADLVVLAIDVIVAILGAAHLVASDSLNRTHHAPDGIIQDACGIRPPQVSRRPDRSPATAGSFSGPCLHSTLVGGSAEPQEDKKSDRTLILSCRCLREALSKSRMVLWVFRSLLAALRSDEVARPFNCLMSAAPMSMSWCSWLRCARFPWGQSCSLR